MGPGTRPGGAGGAENGCVKVRQQSPRETQSLRSKNENQSNTRTMQSKSCPARMRAPCAHRVRTAANTGEGEGDAGLGAQWAVLNDELNRNLFVL